LSIIDCMAVAPPDGENAGETGRAYSIAS